MTMPNECTSHGVASGSLSIETCRWGVSSTTSLKITDCSDARQNIPMDDMKTELSEDLKDKKNMLVVLDDVWEENVLRSVASVVLSRAGCKILVTTCIE